MLINKVQTSPAFGKIKVMQCLVKDSKTKKQNSATLYKLDYLNPSDLKDVMYNRNTAEIQTSFFIDNRRRISDSEYFVLCNDKNGEIVSCAKTEHRYRTIPENPGPYTLIQALGENKNYVNSVEPMVGYIVKNAEDRFDNSVYAAYKFEEKPALKELSLKRAY